MTLNLNKNIIDKLPASVKKSELIAKLTAMENEQARQKAMQKKMIIAGAAIAGVAAAAVGAYMILSKKEITFQLSIEDRQKPQAGDACCCTEDEPVEEAAECCECAVGEEPADDAAECCCACDEEATAEEAAEPEVECCCEKTE
ncbi:MAG: hypothetical protein E7463_05010 [Ruminococcaceae bacterium]|nr:hypothetical protein [Oscillospiraceae bacterium]